MEKPRIRVRYKVCLKSVDGELGIIAALSEKAEEFLVKDLEDAQQQLYRRIAYSYGESAIEDAKRTYDLLYPEPVVPEEETPEQVAPEQEEKEIQF